MLFRSLQQRELRAYDDAHGILTEAWSPLARGLAVANPVLASIGEKYGKSAAQVALRWHIEQGLVVIPKSNSVARIRENSLVFDFVLDADDLAAIAALETGERTGSHPDRVS